MAEEEEDGSLDQELEVLQSIYLDELEVSQEEDGLMVRITLHPTTGDDTETQYVRLTLQLSIPPLYPREPPGISVSNPRGLGDEEIASIIGCLRTLAVQSMGCPILYALIEKGKELLTASNLPRGHCVICLYEFQEDDSLTKTPCFHHFHSYCLGRYVKHCLDSSSGEESAECPVCRENLHCDFNKLQAAAPPQQPEEKYVPDTITLKREKELHEVYQRQLANGGIIDLEAEKNRFFISIQEIPASEDEDGLLQAGQASVHQLDPVTEGRAEHSPPSIVSKPHVEGHRVRGKMCGHRPFRSDHPEGQRDNRGWTARGRRRPDTHRGWREEAASKDDQSTTRGRVTARSWRSNGTVQTPPRGGSSEGSRGAMPDL